MEWDFDPVADIIAFVNGLIEAVYEKIDWCFAAAGRLLTSVREALQESIDYVYGLAEQALSALDAFKVTALDWINSAIDIVKEGYEWVIGQATDFFTTGLGILTDTIDNAHKAISDLTAALSAQLKFIYDTYIKPLETALKDLTTDIEDITKTLTDPASLLKVLEETITAMW
ncbi:hypothetical protein ES708_18740 [subsurface metagenome]